MKKTLIIIMMALLGMTQMVAQEEEYEYVPFVREGVKWVCTHGYSHNPFTLELKGDYEFNGKSYKAMHKYSGNSINPENDTIPVYLREEGKVVYGIVPDGKIYNECPIGIEDNQAMESLIKSGKEFVLYDFSNLEEFIEGFLSMCYYKHKVIWDIVTINGKEAKRCIFRHAGHDYCIIEGIGCDGRPHGYPLAIMRTNGSLHLSHVIENGVEIYRSECYKNRPQDEPILPIDREGVQWVNERVIVNAGDTTRQYYCYEFSGMDRRKNPVCYSYTGDTLDTSIATIAAKFQDTNYMGLVNGCIYDNEPYAKVLAEGRQMINIATGMPGYYQLYSFNETYSDIDYSSPLNYYVYNQREEFLTRQNFTEVEPVEIEGVQCRRYAYVDESGEVQAYLVEGIGFDSRDMGDLLTPFTRKPDPDAEYQEWCGLSHVIKDGKIIYKGLRYDAAAVEGLTEELPGDVNDDGIVDISDVTTMIDLVLNGRQLYRAPADMDSDGSVDINDVTNLISIVLGNK